VIAGLLAWLGTGRLGRAALRIGLLAAAVLLLLLACRRSGKRLGRLAERLETAKMSNEIQRELLEAAAHGPRDRDELPSGCATGGSDGTVTGECTGREIRNRAIVELQWLAATRRAAA
jgi:hypothetical protein